MLSGFYFWILIGAYKASSRIRTGAKRQGSIPSFATKHQKSEVRVSHSRVLQQKLSTLSPAAQGLKQVTCQIYAAYPETRQSSQTITPLICRGSLRVLRVGLEGIIEWARCPMNFRVLDSEENLCNEISRPCRPWHSTINCLLRRVTRGLGRNLDVRRPTKALGIDLW